MATFLLIFTICLLTFGVMVAVLMVSRTPRFRTEPEHLLKLFDEALANRMNEAEWYAITGYPIYHDDYLDGVRRRARRIMDEHGLPDRMARGKPLLDATGRSELTALRAHLATRTALRRRHAEG